ncbi:MAG: ribosomal-processing cysteine protease Prp, partial [Sellimonas intestinalis]
VPKPRLAVPDSAPMPAGEDIVCASVSILVINTISSIETFTQDKAAVTSDEKSGRIEYHLFTSPSKETTLLFSSMVLGLQSMEENEEYKYIDLRFREV